ncbi:hypothetical protein C8A00DRAFT_12747 [Chaetomidium leptoderma]|uniref:C2H2-type domain-containing protein n=1 Tax=Chaetomidium leptoderma TaxID=669021 RepID=A0AAN6ZZX5_9PEZI|nr:hypothetical protein C8A00DRAFT_12747 [Chaetomidium leptoderma]
MVVTCRECKLEVANNTALVVHWEEQRDLDAGHYHCSQCMDLYHTPEAEHRHHKEQDLGCPGSDERFVTASGLIEHIEKNRCKKVKNDDYAARREEKLAFARGLQRRHNGEDVDLADHLSVANLSLTEESMATQKGPQNFTQFLSRTKDVPVGIPSLSSLRPKADRTVRPNPVTFAMMKKKNLFPDAPAAVRPTAEKMGALQKPAETKQPEWPAHDPRNPQWDPAKYYVKYINKYKCPHDRCPKSFPSAAGLRSHLLSAKHAGLLKVQCPHCYKWFDSMAAITAHAESQGVRCTIRETNGYRQFIDQLTAGIVDTAGSHGDGTEKYVVPQEARQVFGTSQGRWVLEQLKQQENP